LKIGRATGGGILLIAYIILAAGCTPEQQNEVQSKLAGAAKTAAAYAQTQVVKVGQTAVADGLKQAQTKAAVVKDTLAAQLSTEAARVVSTVIPPDQKGNVLDYFALGDSIASGYGLMDDGSACHRSKLSYPYIVLDELEKRYDQVNFLFLACSGATAGEPDAATLAMDRYKWFRNQVDEVLRRLSSRPTLITINIGANDLRWSDPGVILPHLVENGDKYLDWVSSISDTVAGELRAQLVRLANGHPNVMVLVTNLYNPFNNQSVFFSLPPACTDILNTLDCYQRAYYEVSGLNNALVLDVYVPLGRPAWLRVVPVEPLFDGHAAPSPYCGDAAPGVNDTWIQYPGDPNSNGDVPLVMNLLVTHNEHGDCFHPNEKGAAAIANIVNEYALKLGR
jgi:lysophospholipase L1-like esterase